jgi:mRNA interferase RelE/StbE
MASTIEFSPAAQMELKKLDNQKAKRILTFLYSRVAPLDSPRPISEALTGSELVHYWKYRVGD